MQLRWCLAALILLVVPAVAQSRPLVVVSGDRGTSSSVVAVPFFASGSSHADDKTPEIVRRMQEKCPGTSLTLNHEDPNRDYFLLVSSSGHDDSAVIVLRADKSVLFASKRAYLRTVVKQGCEAIMRDWKGHHVDRHSSNQNEKSSDSPSAPGTLASESLASGIPAKPEPATDVVAVAKIYPDASIGASADGDPEVRHDGVTLTKVVAGSSADQAGLKAGDVVLAINDRYLFTPAELGDEICHHQPGSKITVRFRRRANISETSLIVSLNR